MSHWSRQSWQTRSRKRQHSPKWNPTPELVIMPFEDEPPILCDSIEEIAAVPLTKVLRDELACESIESRGEETAALQKRQAHRQRVQHWRRRSLSRLQEGLPAGIHAREALERAAGGS